MLYGIALKRYPQRADLLAMTYPPGLATLQPADLPAPPQAALAMLRAITSDVANNRQLADFAQLDPVLSAEVLRVVNSPLFGIASDIASVQHAISLLGIRALRNIVLCLMVREAVAQQTIPGVDITHFWEDSLRRAAAARALGCTVGLDAEECFSAGLLQDFGLLILLSLQPHLASQFAHLRGLDPVQRLQHERELFTHSHEQIAALLAQQWSLPASFAQAIAQHHDPEVSEGLASVLYAADWVNALFCVSDINALLVPVRELLAQRFKLAFAQIDSLMRELPEQVRTAAHALGLDINAQVDFAQLLRQANSRLVQENLSYQALTWQLEKTIAERDRLAQEFTREIVIAREVQQRLMPVRIPAEYPLHGINLPARNISGDFFDFFTQADGTIWFALGDVSGKGINAGLLMAKTASLFHCLAKHMRDPAQLLQIINDELYERSIRGTFVTMVAGIYQPATKQVQLVNAGHMPALVVRGAGQVERLPATEQPLGILPQACFKLSAPVALHEASLYLYTDGVTEAPWGDGGLLGEEGLLGLLQHHAHRPPAQRLQAIVQAIESANRPGTSLHDDITLLMIDGRH